MTIFQVTILIFTNNRICKPSYTVFSRANTPFSHTASEFKGNLKYYDRKIVNLCLDRVSKNNSNLDLLKAFGTL